MTKAQHMRIERRNARIERERYQREQVMRVAIIVLFVIVAFLLAGTLDYHDRTEGLGASMVPAEMGW